MGRLLSHDPEQITQAHLLYAQGQSQRAVAAAVGIPVSTLRYHLKRPLTQLAPPPRPILRQSLEPKNRPLLIARLWTAAERQVHEIEARLVEAGGDAATLERDARTLAILAKTVRDLMALDAAANPKPDKDDGENTPPRNIDAFRRALAQKLEELGALEADDGDSRPADAGGSRPAGA